MKTRCPDCLTIFRISPEQLVARDGKVRCGHCRAVFNALDTLLDDPRPLPQPTEPDPPPPDEPAEPAPAAAAHEEPERHSDAPEKPENHDAPPAPPAEPDVPEAPPKSLPPRPPERGPEPLAAGPVLSHGPGGIPDYGQWAGGVIAPPLVLPSEKPLRWPFALASVALALALAGQALFHFRGELALAAPALRPALERISPAPLPLPRHIDFISIEASDLQSDPTRAHLFILNATLRNKAHYGQAYPSLVFSLTDVQDSIIARRTFSPGDYLPNAVSRPVFSGNSDTAIRLWIEAADIDAAGYRLFVFYP